MNDLRNVVLDLKFHTKRLDILSSEKYFVLDKIITKFVVKMSDVPVLHVTAAT